MPKTSLALAKKPTAKIAPKTQTVQKPAPVVINSTRLDRLLDERLAIGAKLSQLETRKKELDVDILKTTVTKSGAEDGALDTGEFVVRAIPSSNSTVSREKLAKLGVKASTIDAATVRTQYSYTRITRKKADDVTLEQAMED